MKEQFEVTDPDVWEEWVYDTEEVEGESIVEQSRWMTFFTKVVKKGGKFYRLNWESGSTEMQDLPFEDEYHSVQEVHPVEKTVIVYE